MKVKILFSVLLTLETVHLSFQFQSDTAQESCEREHLGCWTDKLERAISGGIRFTSDYPIEDCERYATQQGYSVFAVQYNTECFTASDAGDTFQQYGVSDSCINDGRGGSWAQDVYHLPCSTDPKIPVVRVTAKSWYRSDMRPAYAHDGDYHTFYSVKDKDTDGNFLRLVLSEPHRIEYVKVTNRLDHCCQHRITGTKVEVRINHTDEIVGVCGIINDYNKLDTQLRDKDAQTYTLDCNGAVGDVIYITDTVIERFGDGNTVGHGISEVQAFGSIPGWIPVLRMDTTSTIERDPVKIPWDLENIPLQIRVDSEVGSNEMLSVRLYSEQDEWAGSFDLNFSYLSSYGLSPPRYYMYNCLHGWQTLTTSLPDGEKIFTLYRTPGGIKIECNGVQILNVVLSDDLCDDTDWRDEWNKDVEMIAFALRDSASDYYRPLIATPCKLLTKKDIERSKRVTYSGKQTTPGFADEGQTMKVKCKKKHKLVKKGGKLVCQAGKWLNIPACEKKQSNI